jgi:hypothetical protein
MWFFTGMSQTCAVAAYDHTTDTYSGNECGQHRTRAQFETWHRGYANPKNPLKHVIVFTISASGPAVVITMNLYEPPAPPKKP